MCNISLQYCISLNRYPCHIFNHRLLKNYFYICFEEDVLWAAHCALLLVFISLFSVVWSVCSCHHWHNRVIFEWNMSERFLEILAYKYGSLKEMPYIWWCVFENTFLAPTWLIKFKTQKLFSKMLAHVLTRWFQEIIDVLGCYFAIVNWWSIQSAVLNCNAVNVSNKCSNSSRICWSQLQFIHVCFREVSDSLLIWTRLFALCNLSWLRRKKKLLLLSWL